LVSLIYGLTKIGYFFINQKLVIRSKLWMRLIFTNKRFQLFHILFFYCHRPTCYGYRVDTNMWSNVFFRKIKSWEKWPQRACPLENGTGCFAESRMFNPEQWLL